MYSFSRKKIPRGTLILAFIFFLYAGMALAQDEPRLDLQSTVEKEVTLYKDGQTRVERIPVEEAAQGDILVFTVTYVNGGETDAVDAVIVNPVPRGVVYVPESAEGEDTVITCSIDDGLSWHQQPVMTTVKNPDGGEVREPAPADHYTHIRWIIQKPVAPGQSGRVSFRATVE